jgi:uncharacterized protein (TIGR02145 family)
LLSLKNERLPEHLKAMIRIATFKMILNLQAIKFFKKLMVFQVLIFSLLFSVASSAQQNVGIGNPVPDASAKLDITSTNQGLLIPRMTTTQRNAIASPANSLLIYNITTNCFEWWNATNSTWVSMSCGGGCTTAPSAPTAGTSIDSTVKIVWNWNASAGATTYYYNTVNNFSSATSNGASASYTQTGLTCGTAYTLYVWASNTCGNSAATTLSQSTSACGATPTCGSQVWASANLNAGTIVDTGTTQTGNQKWCYNGFAANCATYGGLYQWADVMGGSYSNTTQSATIINCDPCSPTSTPPGVQGMCPTGYHVPSDLEWSRYEYCIENTIAPTGNTSLINFQTGNGYLGSTASGVGPGDKMKVTSSNTPPWDGTNTSGFSMLPAGYYNTTTINNPKNINLGNYGYYWTATDFSATLTYSRDVKTGSAQIFRGETNKLTGFSVRCLKD